MHTLPSRQYANLIVTALEKRENDLVLRETKLKNKETLAERQAARLKDERAQLTRSCEEMKKVQEASSNEHDAQAPSYTTENVEPQGKGQNNADTTTKTYFFSTFGTQPKSNTQTASSNLTSPKGFINKPSTGGKYDQLQPPKVSDAEFKSSHTSSAAGQNMAGQSVNTSSPLNEILRDAAKTARKSQEFHTKSIAELINPGALEPSGSVSTANVNEDAFKKLKETVLAFPLSSSKSSPEKGAGAPGNNPGKGDETKKRKSDDPASEEKAGQAASEKQPSSKAPASKKQKKDGPTGTQG